MQQIDAEDPDLTVSEEESGRYMGSAQSSPFKVVVIVSYPSCYYDPARKQHRGFIYDLWLHVREEMEEKYGYTFDETYIESSNYTETLSKYLSEKGFDIAVGAFTVLHERTQLTVFTRQVALGRHCLVVKDSVKWGRTLKNLFTQHFMPTMMWFSIIGIVLGLVMYLNTKKVAEIPVAISAVFGNHDFMPHMEIAETHKDLDGKQWYIAMFLLAVLAIISTFVFVYIGAYLTEKLVEAYESDGINIDNIAGKQVVSPQGYSSGKVFGSLGASVKYIDGSNEELMKLVSSSNEYEGVTLSYFDAVTVANQNKMRVSKAQFGFDKQSFALNLRHKGSDLLRHIDEGIIRSNVTMNTADIFGRYLGTESRYLAIV